MMGISVDDVKGLDLVEFLTHHYGMRFCPVGDSHASLSVFTGETEPSFFVRQVDGHWLFKDFSSGHAGSIIDFVLVKEGLSEVSEALRHIDRLLASPGGTQKAQSGSAGEEGPGYDITGIYRAIKGNDQAPCRQYLAGRGISEEIIDDLAQGGILLHNRYQGHSWCCFAVFDQKDELCCLDNHQIGGDGKFVLGRKEVFTRDWQILPEAGRVFVCEGIIDYLSMKSLRPFPGIALLGNSVRFDPGLFKSAHLIISALDSDEGGLRALLDLQERFPDKEISVCNLGSCKDPNEYLQAVKAGKEPNRLTAEEKLALYKEFMRADTKSEVALRWGTNRSYLYQIVKECEEIVLQGFQERRPGRKCSQAPATLAEAIDRIAALEEEKEHAQTEKERYYARSEFMKLRLKWAEVEAAELRGQKGKSGQIKKNRKGRDREPV